MLSPRLSSLVAFSLAPFIAAAAERTWTGATDTSFANPVNWTGNLVPADDLTTDIGRFTGTLSVNQPQLSASRSLNGLLFSTSNGGWTLSSASSSYTFTLGSGGLSSAGQTSGTNTITAPLLLGAAQTWQTGTGGRLLVTGSVTQGSGFSWTINTSTNQGTLTLSPANGSSVNLIGANDTLSLVQIKSGGVLQLGGTGPDATTSVNTIKSTSSTGGYGTWGINGGGKLQVNSGTWITGDLGKNGGDNFNGTLEVTGGSISFTGARYLGAGSILVSGGTLAVTATGGIITNGGRFSLGAFASGAGTATLNLTGGLVDLAQANGGNSFGTALNTQVDHSGGTLQNGLTVGGGTNGGTVTTLTLGAGAATSNIAAAYTLRGTGVLFSAGAIQGQALTTGTGNVRNFNFTGGTLAVSAFNATNLGYASATGLAGGAPHADPIANCVGLGTLYNHGGTLAPGGLGTAGKTSVTGNYVALGGSLAVDLGGTTQATAFQHASGDYDVLTVSGTTALGGSLAVNILPGFTPTSAQSFTVLASTGALSGAFTNVPFGSRVVSADGLHTFVVNQSGTNVVLNNYAAVVAPVISSFSAPAAIAESDTVVLGVSVDSLAPVTYEWRKNGVLIVGATSSSIALPQLQPGDTGAYQVTATNAAGVVTRTFTVRFSAPPSTATVLIDAKANHTFSAGNGATAYQWILDGDTVGTASTFNYAPATKAVGTHWLRVIETYADASTVTRHWNVRVRIPLPVSALAYYVSPTGSDSAAGSLGAPFLTLEKARDTIRALSSGQRSGGVTVYLRGGIHRRTTTFALAAQDSGTESAPVVYAAYPGETPVLTGARSILASQVSPLAVSEQSRLAPGIDPARVFEIDVTGNPRAATFPSVFNEWWIYNALRSSQNGGLFELFYNGNRMPLSRYPNSDPTDDTLTTNLTMNGVATGADTFTPPATATGYLNGAGTYTDSLGNAVAVGGAFQYNASDAAHVARWQTAMTKGGVWLAGYWRVPWQVNAVKIGLLDTGAKQVIALASGASVSNGIGNKYARPLGNKKEPYWAINLLEELDQTGEWCVDFNRKKLYILLDSTTALTDGSIELSDLGTPLFQLNGASDIYLQGLSFRRQLGHAVQILGGARDLVLGCAFSQNGNFAVDINGGTSHGVVSCTLEKLGSGGVILRGGTETPALVNSDQFVVNNKFTSFGEVVRVYQAAIDSGFGGPIGSNKQVSVGTRVAHNDAKGSPHGAILWGSYNQILEYNNLSDYCRISEDFGAIYHYNSNYQSASVIRYNYPHDSRLGEGIYNDYDHLEVAIYGNVTNLHTPSTASRGYGFWTNTNTAVGGSVPNVPMGLNLTNNIAVNSRSNYSLHSATGGVIQNNISYRKIVSDFLWYRITSNSTTSTNSYSTSNAATLQSGPNIAYTTDPGFIDFANDDLRLRPDAKAYTDMPGFVPIPLEMAGLYNDEYRSDAAVATPFVVTGSATSVGANTATFAGTLVYPQFDANATVRVYWGTTDGGTDPAAWQNVTNLGQPGSGYVGLTRADLTPGTRYYFRFYAMNAAGEHWSEQSNSTTTFPLVAAPSGGTATTDSSGTSAALAFDSNTATAWQTATGTTSGVLTYQFASNAAVVVTRYTVTSAADSPARDPRDWQFLGSYDGINWVVLDTRTGQSFSARGQTLTYGFASTAAFKFYRLLVTANNGDASVLQLAELALFSPSVTADTTGPVITTPGNLTVSGSSSSGANVTFDVSAIDAVSGNTSATASPASGSFFAAGSTTVTVTATDAAGNTSTATFTITVTAPPLSAPWSISQIQPFSGVANGTATTISSTSFQIVGTGGSTSGGTTGDIWTGNNDSFTFLSQPWTGDGTFTARITAFSSTDASAKAGIMFRETSSTGSRYSFTYFLRKGDAWAQHKTATSGSTTNVNFFSASSSGKTFPYWIRLVRTGDLFTNFISPDGVTWTQLGTVRSNPLGGTALSVGFAVGPRTGNTAATVTFDNIQFLSPLQSWRQVQFGTTTATGNAADLADPDGDGRPNLLEYALGSLPNSADSAPATTGEAVSEDPTLPPRLTLTFNRIADPVLTYAVETSDSPAGAWTTLWSSTGSNNIAGPVTVVDTVDLTTATPTRRFMRLRVTTP
jgi:hypothetical protein